MTVSEGASNLLIQVKGRVTPITIELYDVRGALLGVLWSGTAPISVAAETNHFAKGAAVVIMKAPEQSLLQAVKVII